MAGVSVCVFICEWCVHGDKKLVLHFSTSWLSGWDIERLELLFPRRTNQSLEWQEAPRGSPEVKRRLQCRTRSDSASSGSAAGARSALEVMLRVDLQNKHNNIFTETQKLGKFPN